MSGPTVSPTRRRGKNFLSSVVLLLMVSGPALAQGPDPDAVRQALLLGQARAADAAAMRQILLMRAGALAVPGGASVTLTDEQFEAVVFSQYGNAVAARQRLESQLTLLVEDIDRACRLTAEQKNKVRLTGRGDIKRFFDGFEKVKEQFRSANNDISRLQELQSEIDVFQVVLQTSLFQDDSLVSKSMRHALTEEQSTRYDSLVQERRTAEKRAIVQQVVTFIERGSPLRFDSRLELTDLLTKETKPPRKPSQYDVYVVTYQIGRWPDEKLRPLLDDNQRRALKQLAERSQMLEPTMRQQGLIPD
jgi:hypothetical protein